MKHVFITGCPRSGTTMLASILGNGNSCVAAPESHFFTDFIYKYLAQKTAIAKKADLIKFFNNHYRFKQWEVNANEISNLPENISYSNYNIIIENTLRLFAKNHSEITNENFVRIDHTPSNIKQFEIVNDLFPESKFLFIVRDPRGVYASIKDLDWGTNSALRLSKTWMEYAAFYFAVQKLYPERIRLVRYEDILSNSANEIRKLCNFIGIAYRDSLLTGGGFKVPKYTVTQHALVGKSLDKNRVRKWKKELNEKDILIIESQCKTLMRAFGYEGSQAINFNIGAKEKLRAIFKEMYYYLPNKLRKKTRENRV